MAVDELSFRGAFAELLPSFRGVLRSVRVPARNRAAPENEVRSIA